MSKRITPETPGAGEPPAGPPLTNPPWVRFAAISMIVLLWVLPLVNVIRGDPWQEAVLWAVIGTICLSAVDITIGRGPRPPRN